MIKNASKVVKKINFFPKINPNQIRIELKQAQIDPQSHHASEYSQIQYFFFLLSVFTWISYTYNYHPLPIRKTQHKHTKDTPLKVFYRSWRSAPKSRKKELLRKISWSFCELSISPAALCTSPPLLSGRPLDALFWLRLLHQAPVIPAHSLPHSTMFSLLSAASPHTASLSSWPLLRMLNSSTAGRSPPLPGWSLGSLLSFLLLLLLLLLLFFFIFFFFSNNIW